MGSSEEERQRIYEEEAARRDAREELDEEGRKRRNRRAGLGCLVTILAIIVIIVVVIVATSGGNGEPTSPAQATRESQEQSSRLACTHMRNVARDYSSGLLTWLELRDKLKEVYDDAIIATPEVYVASRDMLAAATAIDLDELASAVEAMNEACTAAGW